MRRYTLIFLLFAADAFSAALFPWQVWGVVVVTSALVCAYLYQTEISLAYRFLRVEVSRTKTRAILTLGFVLIAPFTLIFGYSWFADRSCLPDNLPQISWAIDEKDFQHFENELRKLYPQLEICGLRAPLIDPVRIGHQQYDSTWHGFHLTFLKVLRRWIRNGDVDVDQWNMDVDRENQKRTRAVDNHLTRPRHAEN